MHDSWLLSAKRPRRSSPVIAALALAGGVLAFAWLTLLAPPLAQLGALVGALVLVDRALAIPPLEPVDALPPDPLVGEPTDADRAVTARRHRLRRVIAALLAATAGLVVGHVARQLGAGPARYAALPAALATVALVGIRGFRRVDRHHGLVHGAVWLWPDALALVGPDGAWRVPLDRLACVGYRADPEPDHTRLTLIADGHALRLTRNAQLPGVVSHLQRHAVPRLCAEAHRRLEAGERLVQTTGRHDPVALSVLCLLWFGAFFSGMIVLQPPPNAAGPIGPFPLTAEYHRLLEPRGLAALALLVGLSIAAYRRWVNPRLIWEHAGLRVAGAWYPWHDVGGARLSGMTVDLLVDSLRPVAFHLDAPNALVALDLLRDFVPDELPPGATQPIIGH